ncbi:ArsR/SmtB family transcription factor [Cytobacillus kochii]|uniref:ArsR/SmtB family transcription factor n=1 Tax=Cytobacillus kochii TaxID=859143 RepID=UPI00402AE001
MVAKVKLDAEVCEVICNDEEKVSRVKQEMSDITGLELIFKALSDATRIKIAYALTIEEELCVCDVATIIDCSMATASHHLRLLKNIGLAKFRKEGKLVYYSLDDLHVKKLIQIAYIHHQEGRPNQ